jgi:hypothetical protein
MKKFKNWLNEEDLRDMDKSEGHKKATLLMNYIDPNDLIAGLTGQPTKSIIYRFMSIVETLPAHEKAEFQKQIQQLQMQYGQQAAAQQAPQGEEPEEGQEEQQEEPQQ